MPTLPGKNQNSNFSKHLIKYDPWSIIYGSQVTQASAIELNLFYTKACATELH